MRSLALRLTLLLLIAAAPLASQDRHFHIDPQNRWQVRLSDGSYLWELRLGRLQHDTLVVYHEDTLARIPLAQIEELRRVAMTSNKGRGEPGMAAGALGAFLGADDEIIDLAYKELPERRRLVEEALRTHPVDSTLVTH